MNYTIENEFLRVEFSDLGAEMMSLVGKKTGFEYLWQGDPTYWKGRATVLFPVCCRLTEGKYTYHGKTYEMAAHGFAKSQVFAVVDTKADAITFELRPNEETRAAYPFDFIFRVTYTLDGAALRTTMAVENTGAEVLPFSCGGHPGFNIPFAAGESFEDYYLEFACEKPVKSLVMSPTCFYMGKTEPFALREGRFLDMKHNLFDNDAIFLEDMCNHVSLKSKKNDRAVTVRFEKVNHLVLWHARMSDAPYVCIEPMNGVPAYQDKIDDIETKNEIIHLPAGENYSTYFDIIITE